MKILALNASHRGDRGRTRFLVDKLVLGAEAAGATCTVITLARHRVNRCLSCRQCQTAKHHLRCVYEDKDDVRAIFERMAEADILVYATPVYLYAMSGLLKTFLDRIYGTGDVAAGLLSDAGLIHHHIDARICSKPFVTLVVCANVEEETPRNVVSYFRTYARFMNAPQVGVLVRNAVDLLAAGPEPERGNPRIRAVYQAYEQAGRELATRGAIRRATQRRANQEIAPLAFFHLLKHLRPIKRAVIAYTRTLSTKEGAQP